jgi:hypothetical protein
LSADLAISPVLQAPSVRAEKAELRSFVPAKTADAAQQFEAFVLQSFVEELLPKDADSVFGGGLAGGYWKSLLSEKLAGVIAEQGDIGIAQYLRKGAGSGVALTGTQSLAPSGSDSLARLADAALLGASTSQQGK